MPEFYAVCYLFSPLLLGLTFHGVCIKFGWLELLVTPIDRGRNYRGKPLFGANKTFRGVAAMSLGTALGFTLQAVWFHQYPAIEGIELFEYTMPFSIFLGLLVGMAAALSELPNSFIKRQMDIAPGRTSTGWRNAALFIFDQVDFLIGSWLVLAFVVETTLIRILYSFIFLIVTHQTISALGYFLGMRRSVR